jgi:hypothetical protein
VNMKDLLSITEGLRLEQSDSKKTKTKKTGGAAVSPVMFVTSYRRRTRQLTEDNMKSTTKMIRALSKHNNFAHKLTSIKDNKSLYTACLDSMHSTGSSTSSGNAEACVLVLRRGPLEDRVRATLKETIVKHRHLNWIQIDLDDHALQPMPPHEKKSTQDGKKKRRTYAHQWPRVAIARTSPAPELKEGKKNKKKKKKKKKKKSSVSTTAKAKKDVTSWQWYPSTSSLDNADALHSWINTADMSEWSILDPLPIQSSKKLRIVPV